MPSMIQNERYRYATLMCVFPCVRVAKKDKISRDKPLVCDAGVFRILRRLSYHKAYLGEIAAHSPLAHGELKRCARTVLNL